MSAPDASPQPTPGPWHTDGAEIFAADGTWIGETLDIDSPDQGEANATLAAAAPEMLAVLGGVEEFLNGCDKATIIAAEECGVMRAMRSVAAKAEGRDAQ